MLQGTNFPMVLVKSSIVRYFYIEIPTRQHQQHKYRTTAIVVGHNAKRLGLPLDGYWRRCGSKEKKKKETTFHFICQYLAFVKKRRRFLAACVLNPYPTSPTLRLWLLRSLYWTQVDFLLENIPQQSNSVTSQWD